MMLKEFLDTRKMKDDKEDAIEVLFKKFADGVGIYEEIKSKIFDTDIKIVYVYYGKRSTKQISKDLIKINIGMDTIPLKNKEWDLDSFEDDFRKLIMDAIFERDKIK